MQFSTDDTKAIYKWLEKSQMIFEAHKAKCWQDLQYDYEDLIPHNLDVMVGEIYWDEIYDYLHEDDPTEEDSEDYLCKRCYSGLGCNYCLMCDY